MFSKDFRELIRENKHGEFEVYRIIDKPTGLPVCLKCLELISSEEDEDNAGLCDHCSVLKYVDHVNKEVEKCLR